VFPEVFSMSHQTFAKDVAIIGITNILTNIGGFLLLPIITKTLGSYDYGIWAQISVTISLISSIALLGLSNAFVRFLAAEKDPDEIREGFYSIVLITLLSGLAFSLAIFFMSEILSMTFFGDASISNYVKLASFLTLFMTLDQIVMFYFRIFRQIYTYAFFISFNVFGKLGLILIFLLKGFGLFGVIIAVLIVQSTIFISASILIIIQIGFKIPKFIRISDYLKYGAPLIPNSLIRWITDSSDRYMVGLFLGINAVGIYSASYTIGNLVQFLVTPLQLILFPELSKIYDEYRYDEVKLYLNYSMKYFLLIAIPAVVGLTVLSLPILKILTDTEFVSGSPVIPIIALAGLMGGIFQILINITHLVKKTRFNLVIHIAAATINILLNIFLVPSLGIVGAALATLASYVLMVIAVFYVSSKYISIDIPWGVVLKSVTSSIFMAIVITIISPKNIVDLVISVIAGIIIYSSVCLILGILNNNEMGIIKKYINHLIDFGD